MKALVTGGLGFVGSRLVHKLTMLGWDVVVMDNLATGKLDNVPHGTPICLANVDEAKWVDFQVKQADVVFHLACENQAASERWPEMSFRTNVQGTYNVVEACKRYAKRLVFASSVSVYGDQGANVGDNPITEMAVLKPNTVYACHKAAAEQIVKGHNNYAILRYSNVYGPGQRPDNPDCGIVAKLFASAMRPENGMVSIPYPDATRDYTFISDVVDATLLAGQGGFCGTFNIGTGKATSVRQLAEMVGRIKPFAWEIGKPRKIDTVAQRCISARFFWLCTHWQPKVFLDAGLIETAWWLADHPEVFPSPAPTVEQVAVTHPSSGTAGSIPATGTISVETADLLSWLYDKTDGG